MVFCNKKYLDEPIKESGHNPYFNRWFSAIYKSNITTQTLEHVTILILIDGFLQCQNIKELIDSIYCHNPYFNRWFSAILEEL